MENLHNYGFFRLVGPEIWTKSLDVSMVICLQANDHRKKNAIRPKMRPNILLKS